MQIEAVQKRQNSGNTELKIWKYPHFCATKAIGARKAQ